MLAPLARPRARFDGCPRESAPSWLSCSCLVALLSSCGSCNDEPPAIATLIETQGSNIERDFAAQVQAWQVAQVGAHFGVGMAFARAPRRPLV